MRSTAPSRSSTGWRGTAVSTASRPVRIGVHEEEAVRVDEGYRGIAVHEGARIAALADGGEIVADAACGRPRAGASEPRFVTVKGISRPDRGRVDRLAGN